MKDRFFIECTIIIAQKGGALKTGAHPTDWLHMRFILFRCGEIDAGNKRVTCAARHVTYVLKLF
jgi:hypothetical protein